MSCPKAKSVMASLFKNKWLTQELWRLSWEYQQLQNTLRWATDQQATIVKSKIARKKRQLDASIIAAWLWDPASKIDLINQIWTRGFSAIEILKWIDLVDVRNSLNDFAAEFWVQAIPYWKFKKSLENYIANDESIKAMFPNVTNKEKWKVIRSEENLSTWYVSIWWWKVLTPAWIEVDIDSLLDESFDYTPTARDLIDNIEILVWKNNEPLNYYLVMRSILTDSVSPEKVLKELKKAKVPKWEVLIDSDVLISNVSEAKTVDDILDIVKYNLYSFKGNKELVDVLVDKFIEAKAWLKWDKDWLAIKYMINLINEVTPNTNVALDRWVRGRLKLMWYTDKWYEATADSAWQLINWNIKSFKVGDSKVSNTLEAIKILWPVEIVRRSRKWKTNKSSLSGKIYKWVESWLTKEEKIALNAFAADNWSTAVEITEALLRWDSDKMNEILTSLVSKRKTEVVRWDSSKDLLQSYTQKTINFDKPSVYYTWEDIYKWASKEAKEPFEVYEWLHNAHAVDTDVEVIIVRSQKELKNYIASNKWANVFTPSQIISNNIDFVKSASGWNIIVTDRWNQFFSYGTFWNRLTIRARSETLLKELTDNLNLVWYKHESVWIDYDAPKQLFKPWLLKSLNLNNLQLDIVDFWKLYDETMNSDLTPVTKILEEVRDHFNNIGYKVKDDIKYNEEELRSLYFDWKYAWSSTLDEDIITNKLLAEQQLSKYLNIQWEQNTLNHYTLVKFMETLEDMWYWVTFWFAKKLIKEYTETSEISKSFKSTFQEANQKILEERSLNWAWVLDEVMETVKQNLWNSYSKQVPKTPRSWQWYAVVNWESSIIADIRATAWEATEKVSIDLVSVSRWMEAIFKKYDELIRWSLGKATREEIDSIFQRFYIELDEFEFYNLELKVWEALTPYQRKSLVWSKFNLSSVYKEQDLPLWNSIISTMRNNWRNNAEFLSKRLTEINASNSIEKIWVKNTKEWIVTIDDLIIREWKKVPYNDKNSWARYISKDYLKRIPLESKVKFLDELKTRNKQVTAWWFVRKFNEAASLLLRRAWFFQNYKLIDTQVWLLPEAIANNASQIIEEWIDLRYKAEIFKQVQDWFMKTKWKKWVKENRESIRKIINDSVERVSDLVILESWEQLDRLALKNDYFNQFNVYASLRDIDKKAIEKTKKLYWIEWPIRNEYEDFFDLNEQEAINFWVDDLSEMESPEVRDLQERVTEQVLEDIRVELDAAKKIPEAFLEYERLLFEVTARDVLNKNPSTRKLLEWIESTRTESVKASSALNTITSQMWDFLNYIWWFDQMIDWGVGRFFPSAWESISWVRFWWANKLKAIDKLNSAKKQLEEAMQLSDQEFNELIRSQPFKQWTWWYVWLELATYYRQLRKNMWTDWFWAGPATDMNFNKWLHDIYKSFIDIWWDTSNWVESFKEMYSQYRAYKTSLMNNAVLHWIDTPSLKPIVWDIVDWLKPKKAEVLWEWIIQRWWITGQSEDLEGRASTFKKLFWIEDDWMTIEDFTAIAQWVFWYQRVSKAEFLWRTIWSTLKWLPLVAWWLNVTKDILQLWFNVLTWTRWALAYLNLTHSLTKRHSSDELKRASLLRQRVWVWNETLDTSSSFTTQAFSEVDKQLWDYASRLWEWRQSFWEQVYSIFSDARDINNHYEHLQNWRKYSYVWSILERSVDLLRGWQFWRTVEFWLQNGNNLTDILFSWPIKDVAFLEAVKSNSYANFSSLDEFYNFARTQSPEEVDRALSAIKAKANRYYWDILWTNFDSVNQVVNKFTWIKWGMMEWVMMMQRNMSYLNWWGRNRTNSLSRVLNQTANIVFKNWTIFSKKWFDDAINFIENTPEYRAYMHSLWQDVVTALRYAKLTRDEDDEITVSDLYRAINTVSQAMQAWTIIAETRPILWVIQNKIDWNEQFTVWEQILTWYWSLLFSSLSVPTRLVEIVRSAKKIWVQNAITEQLLKAWGWFMRFSMWRVYSWWEYYVPWKYSIDALVRWEDEFEPRTQEFYDTMKRKNIELIKLQPDIFSKIWEFVKQNNLWRVLSAQEDIFKERDKDEDWKAILSYIFEREEVDKWVLGSDTWREIVNTWTTKMRWVSELDDFEWMFIKKNIYAATPSQLFNIVNTFQEWEMKDYWFDLATKELFTEIWETWLSSLRTSRTNLQEELANKKTHNWEKLNNSKRNEILRGQMTQDLLAIQNSKDLEWVQALWVMYEMSEDLKLLPTAKWTEQKKVEKVNFYNNFLVKRSRQAEDQNKEWYNRMIWNREWERINEESWKNIFKEDKDSDWNTYFKTQFTVSRYLEQTADLYEATKNWDFDKIAAEMNIANSSLFTDSDDPLDWIAAWLAISMRLDIIDQSELLSDNEKVLSKIELVKNNERVITKYRDQIEANWWNAKELMANLYNWLYTLESELWDMLMKDIDAMMEQYKDIYSSEWSWSKWKTKLDKLDFDWVKSIKEELSKWLNKRRADYKLDPINTEPRKYLTDPYKTAIAQKYPKWMSAKTKAPSWFTKKQLTNRKDIKRNIKPKKRKISPPL